jgi:hypothetical protein
VVKEKRDYHKFAWQDLGDFAQGRPNLGANVSVQTYRLLQYTLRDAMIAELGVDKADELFIRAGRLAGVQFCRNLLDAAEDRGEVHPFHLPGVSGHSVPRIAGKMT